MRIVPAWAGWDQKQTQKASKHWTGIWVNIETDFKAWVVIYKVYTLYNHTILIKNNIKQGNIKYKANYVWTFFFFLSPLLDNLTPRVSYDIPLCASQWMHVHFSFTVIFQRSCAADYFCPNRKRQWWEQADIALLIFMGTCKLWFAREH